MASGQSHSQTTTASVEHSRDSLRARSSRTLGHRTPADARGAVGVESPTRRRTKQVVVAAVALALLGWLGWAAWEHSQSDVTGELKTFEVIDEHEVRVGVELTRHDGQAIVCDVVAQADDHTTVGEGTVTAPAGPSSHLTATGSVRTDREATSATVSNCRTAD